MEAPTLFPLNTDQMNTVIDISGFLATVTDAEFPPTEYVQVAYAETLSGLTKVQLAVNQVNMVKTVECQRLHAGC